MRRTLEELCDEGVLGYNAIGDAIKPYEVVSLGRALDRGYVTLTRKEVHNFLGVREQDHSGSFSGQFVGNVLDGKHSGRYRGDGDIGRLRTLVSRFFSFASNLAEEQTTRENHILRAIIGSKSYQGIGPYFMEKESLDLLNEPAVSICLGFPRNWQQSLTNRIQ